MFSLFGLIALAGVVVNDSLIMVDFINEARLRGLSVRNAVIESGTARFRAIILTSFTTAAGLTPIIFENRSASAGHHSDRDFDWLRHRVRDRNYAVPDSLPVRAAGRRVCDPPPSARQAAICHWGG